MLDKMKYIVLTPTIALARKKRAEYPEINTMHWQGYFGASHPSEEWKNRDSKITRNQKACIVVIDEVYTWNDSDITEFVGYLYEQGATIIFVGDDKQIKPFNGKDNTKVIDYWTDYDCPELTKDWRSKDDETTEFKDSIRGLKEDAALQEIVNNVGWTSWEEFLEKWTPSALVYATTRVLNEFITRELGKVHRKKFPDEPIPYEFLEDVKVCLNCHDDHCGHAKQHYKGDVVHVPIGEDAPPKSKLAYTSTVHKCLGDSVTNHVYVFDDRNSSAWCQNGLYVAVTRIVELEQLDVVCLPEELEQVAHTVTAPLKAQIRTRISRHRQEDNKRFR
eukprot:gene898-23480_t